MTADAGMATATPVRVWECPDCVRTYVALGEICRLCGLAAKELTVSGRGRLASWTAVHTVPPGEEPYTLGWADLDDVGVGVLGRFTGDTHTLCRGLPVLVRQSDAADGWPRISLEAEPGR